VDSNRTQLLAWAGILALGLLVDIQCRHPGDVRRSGGDMAPPWTLTLAAPIDHLDVVAREPMIVEHPDGTLFVGGFGAPRMGQQQTNEPTLWKSRDGGTTWIRVNVGTEEDGAAGNSDVDLAVSSDGTLYFVNLLFDEGKWEGRQVNVGVSKDVGATWKWASLSKTRFDDRPWVKVAPDGTAHVIWNDGAGVCYAVSQDGGLTWTERDRIHPQGGSSHLAVGPNGEVAVRVTPYSASGHKYDEGADLIAVSTDGGKTWRKHAAPGYREWSPEDKPSVLPRWVEPLAWDSRGALYSFWTNLKGIWLARSADKGATWTTWHLAESHDMAFYPYLMARAGGQLAATWFSVLADMPRAHVARIDVGEGEAPPRMAESQPFEPEIWWPGRSPDDPPYRGTPGEYLASIFLRKNGLAVVSTIQNQRDNRFGFSLLKVEERRGEEAKKGLVKDESVEQELIRLENEWAEAWVKSDAAFSGRIMADDFMWTSPWSKVFSKADNLALIRSGEDVITSWVIDDLKVRVYGDAAVVTGRCAVKETYKGQDVSGQERWTHTWIKIAGRWQCVAGHSSEIAQE